MEIQQKRRRSVTLTDERMFRVDGGEEWEGGGGGEVIDESHLGLSASKVFRIHASVFP